MLHTDMSTEKYAPFSSNPADANTDSKSDLPPQRIMKYSAMPLEARGKKNNSKEVNCFCKTSSLPPGWIREVRQRKTGKTAGQLDVYIIR